MLLNLEAEKTLLAFLKSFFPFHLLVIVKAKLSSNVMVGSARKSEIAFFHLQENYTPFSKDKTSLFIEGDQCFFYIDN